MCVPFGRPEHERHDDGNDSNHIEGTQFILDFLVIFQADYHDGDGAGDDHPRQTGLGSSAKLVVQQIIIDRHHQANDIAPEVDHDGEPGTPLDDCRECRPGIVPAEQAGDHADVGRAAYGQEFSQSLNDADDDRLEEIHEDSEGIAGSEYKEISHRRERRESREHQESWTSLCILCDLCG